MAADPGIPVDPGQQEALALWIRVCIAISLGLALVVGVWRTLKGWPVTWLVLPGYGRISDITGAAIGPMMLRLAVAAGFGFGLGLAGLRLVYGLPLGLVLAPMVAVVALLAMLAPRQLVPLALDSGAIATSVVTVPMIAAYGVAVAETLPGRSALADGFGLIVLAMIGSAFPASQRATVGGVTRTHEGSHPLYQWRASR